MSGQGGALSVSATPEFATRWLAGRLAKFQRQHPHVQLHIKASPPPVDFDQDDVEVAIRSGRGASEGVVAVRLFNEWIAPRASPAILL